MTAWLRGWPVAVLALLVAVSLYRVLASPAGTIIDTDDITRYFHWVHRYIRDELLAGRLPLWNPYNYAGTPFMANPHTAVFYPFTWLVLLMPVLEAHKWMIAVHCLMAGGFMYLFLRRLGLEQAAALAGSMPWMLGGYFMAHAVMGHLTLLFNAAWLPMALYCYERGLQTRRWGWLFAAGSVLGVQLIAGEPQVCYYTSLLIAIYGLVRTIGDVSPGEHRWQPRRYGRWVGGLALVAAVCAATSGIQSIPTVEFALESDRSGNTYEFVTFMSFPVGNFIGYVLPFRSDLRGLVVDTARSSTDLVLNWEYAVYVGLVSLVLAVVSVAARGRPALWAARVLLVVGVILMLGKHTPIYPVLFEYLPGLRMFRMPAQAIVITTWAICVMAAFGFEHLFGPQDPRWRSWRWRIGSVCVLAVVGVGAIIAFKYFTILKQPYVPSSVPSVPNVRVAFGDSMFVVPLCVLAATAMMVLVSRWLPRRAAAAGVLILLAGDLLVSRPGFWLRSYTDAQDKGLQHLIGLSKYEKGRGEPYRVDFAHSFVDAGTSMVARVENVNAYWGAALQRFFRFVHAMRGVEPDPLIRVGLKTALYDHPEPFPLRVLNVRWSTAADYKRRRLSVVHNAEAEPRAWLVDRAEVIPGEEEMLRRMRDPEFNPLRVVLLEQPPRILLATADSPVGTCRARTRPGGGLDVETQSTRDGYLVLSEVFYPGWRATVDGKEVPLERADYLITALPLSAGTHQVEYRYDPVSLKVGAGCTACMCAAGLWVLIGSRRRRSNLSVPTGHTERPRSAAQSSS